MKKLPDFFKSRDKPIAEEACSDARVPVQSKEERLLALSKIRELPGNDFDVTWGHRLDDIKSLRPCAGYVNESANCVCTKSHRVCKFDIFSKKQSSGWDYVGDISAATGNANSVVCLLDFDEVACSNF